MGGAGSCKQFVVTGELVGYLYFEKGLFGNSRSNCDGVVVLGGAFILYVDVEYGKHQSTGFDFFVGESVFAEEFGTADFHPRQVVGMIDDAHHVGFGVTYLDFGDAFDHRMELGE